MSRTQGKPMNVGAQVLPATPVPGANAPADALAALGGARGMVQTRTGYQTAIVVQVPRDIDKIRADVIKEATYARESFFYAMSFNDKSKDRVENGRQIKGKSLIEGTSIDGAMILLRNWGNVVCEPDLADEGPSHWLFKATFIDLEKGTSMPRLFRQRKSQRTGKFDEERALDIAFQIGQSKAIRNAIVNAMPQWLIDEANEAAKAAAAARYANVQEHAEKAVSAWKEKGVTQAQLERKLGKVRANWIPSDLVLLRAIYKAVVDGLSTPGQEFSDEEPAQEREEAESGGAEPAPPGTAVPEEYPAANATPAQPAQPAAEPSASPPAAAAEPAKPAEPPPAETAAPTPTPEPAKEPPPKAKSEPEKPKPDDFTPPTAKK